MPIIPSISTTRLSQADFKDLAHEVMGHVFAIHREFGRFFDEQIYKKELAARIPGIHLEASVSVTHLSFTKTYFADVLAPPGALFEFKLTALTEDLDSFASHAAMLLRHTRLKAILWANLARNNLRFSIIN